MKMVLNMHRHYHDFTCPVGSIHNPRGPRTQKSGFRAQVQLIVKYLGPIAQRSKNLSPKP